MSLREAFMLLDKDLKVDLTLQINGIYGPITSKVRTLVRNPPLQSNTYIK